MDARSKDVSMRKRLPDTLSSLSSIPFSPSRVQLHALYQERERHSTTQSPPSSNTLLQLLLVCNTSASFAVSPFASKPSPVSLWAESRIHTNAPWTISIPIRMTRTNRPRVARKKLISFTAHSLPLTTRSRAVITSSRDRMHLAHLSALPMPRLKLHLKR